MQGVSPKFGHRYWPDAGPLSWLYLTYFFGYLLASAGVFIKARRLHLGQHATGQTFILFTIFSAFIGGATNFPLWYDINIQPYGNVLSAVYLFLWGQGLYNNHVSKKNIRFYKKIFNLILCASGTLVYLLVITHHFSRLNTPLSPESTWIHGIGAFLLIALTSWVVSTIKYQVERALEAVFLNEPTIGLTKLKELPAKFAEFNDNLSLLNFVANSLEQFVPTQNLAIFTKEPESDSYRTVAKRGHFPDAAPLHELASNDPLIKSLTNNPRALDINKVTKGIDSSVYQSLVGLRNASNVSMLIPIFSNQQLLGLILLGPLKSKQDWDNQTTTILFTLSAQIGIHFRTMELEAIVEIRSDELEQRNEQLQKAHIEKHNFLTSFSHEIRNPLNGIINISHLLAEEGGLTDTQSELIDYLISCKQHLEQLIIPTLDYSSLEAGIYNCTEESFDVNIILKSIIAMHAHQAASKGLQMNFDLTEVRNNWIGAVTPLRQILINLVSNAIKYTTSGSVSLHLSYRQLEDNITATFSIKDSGPGISTDRHKDIFEPLTRLTENRNSQPGSGMGLSISRRIAHALQGTLSLKESSPANGSVFELTLPFKLGARIDVNANINKTPLILNDKRVLLADDMDFNRYAYRILLKRMGAIVVEAKNGEQALEKLQSENFDVVILDINMPLMNGLEVAQEYFSTPTATPPVFIAYSAQNDSATADNCLNSGFHHFIEKPLTADKLRLLFNSKESKSIPPQGGLLDYLGGDDTAKVAQLNKRYRQSFNQGLAELTQLIKQREQTEMHSCMHKLRGLACLQNNTNEMRTLDEIAVLIAAKAAPHDYTQLLNQLNNLVTDDAVPVSN